MDNMFVAVAYVAAMIALAGCVVVKVSDILEWKRTEKYYHMIKGDAEFWQMKVEQTLTDITDMMLESATDKFHETMKSIDTELTNDSGKPKEAEKKSKEDLFEGLDEWLPF